MHVRQGESFSSQFDYHYRHVGRRKSLAVRSLEDLGFFCVDNLPPVLIPKFAELIEQSNGKIAKVALVIDLRGREFLLLYLSRLAM